MARQARKRSPSGTYHVMTRGINKMDLFKDDKDKYRYIEVLDKVKEKYNYTLYSYCLMTNHVHLLIRENDFPLATVMKSIGVRFSMYFNSRYKRVGNLFQGRFRSEVIDSENQLLNCARYIHNNPVKGGIVTRPEEFFWSSYRSYLGYAEDPLLRKDLILGIFQNNLARLREFTSIVNQDRFMEYDGEDMREEQGALIRDIEGFLRKDFGLAVRDIRFLKKKTRDEVVKTIKSNFDLSHRELGELLNLSKDLVYRA